MNRSAAQDFRRRGGLPIQVRRASGLDGGQNRCWPLCGCHSTLFSEVSLNLHIVAAKLSTRHQKPQPKKDDAS
jgi:hypothetical protein